MVKSLDNALLRHKGITALAVGCGALQKKNYHPRR